MADDSMSLLETLRKATAEGEVDVLREGVRILAQAIMEAEVSELTGLPKGERDPERRRACAPRCASSSRASVGCAPRPTCWPRSRWRLGRPER